MCVCVCVCVCAEGDCEGVCGHRRCLFEMALSRLLLNDVWFCLQVTNMYGVFLNAESFNQPLDRWNVSMVGMCMYVCV